MIKYSWLRSIHPKTICLHQRSRIQFFIKVICTKRYVKTNIECLHNKSCILNYKQIYLILLCCLHLKVRKLCESKLPLPKITYQYIKVVLIKSLTLESYLFESDRLNYVLHFSKLFFIPLLSHHVYKVYTLHLIKCYEGKYF